MTAPQRQARGTFLRKDEQLVVGARSEFEFIEWIRARAQARPGVTLGIGDDSAVLGFPTGSDCLVAVDMLMEGVHFTLPAAVPRDIGHKALAVNLSDIAAMAGRPLAAVVAVAFPKRRDARLPRELYEGLFRLADEFEVALVGGDTNSWNGPLVVSVTVLAEATGTGPVRRSGALVGDWILATGTFGGSLAGRHLTFTPRVDEALRLHRSARLHAMIDVSDGLAADLHHVLDESRVGAVLFADAIPISDAARAADDGRSPLEHALTDGEDFELLFTVSADDGRRLLDGPPVDVPLSRIGEVVAGGGCALQDAEGNRRPLPPQGWTHQF